jgi:hypothetical protein
MNWNHDLSQAPRDGTHVILAMPNKTTLRSYWCEPKNEPAHWCMLSHKNEPVAWMAWPEHPFASATTSEDALTKAPTNVSLPVDERSGERANAGGDHVTGGGNAHQISAEELVSNSSAFLLEDVGGGA